MSWQTITKENDLAISVVPMRELNLATRIDAEHYQPHFIAVIDAVKKKDYKKLSDLVSKTITTGHTPSMAEESFYGGDVKFIKTDNLRDNHIVENFNHFLSEKGANKLKNALLKEDDIIVTIIGATYDVVGRVARVFPDLGPATINQNISLIRPSIASGYLACFLMGKYGKQQLHYLSRQTEQVNLNNAEVADVLVPLPSDAFANKIHTLHNQTHDLYTRSKKLYSEAEQMLLKEINLEGYKGTEEAISVRNFSEALANNRFDAEYWQPDYDVIQNAIKKHKDGYDTFDNLFVIADKKATIEPDKEYLYAELADVNGAMGTIDNFTAIQGKELPSRGRMSLKKDDVVMSSLDGSLSKIALITSEEKNIIGSTGFFVLRKKEYEPEVALVLLKSKPIQTLLERQGQGTILSAIPKTSLSRVVLPKLNQTLQKKIKELVLTAHKEKEEAKEILEKAKRAVEIFVEKDETEALKYLG